MTRLFEMTVIQQKTKYQHGEDGPRITVWTQGGNTAAIWLEDGNCETIETEFALEYVKQLAPNARIEQRSPGYFEVTPASALFER